jgi:hypothetical protein
MSQYSIDAFGCQSFEAARTMPIGAVDMGLCKLKD